MADALVVDRKGLARKLNKRPKAFIVFELLQNSWDEDVHRVSVTAEMLPGRPVCHIAVEDDCPEGFADLRSIYTLFRDSKKGPDPTKRGRFELGEKLVLALALRAKVTTTKGTVTFEGDERHETREKRPAGTIFEGDFRMTREEFAEICQQVHMLFPPKDIETTFNGQPLVCRKPTSTFETTLQTIRIDEEGNLKATERKTEVRVYETRNGEEAHVYEMGIPVVPTGDKWHYDVQQRVPVNWERNNVPPAFLKTLRVEVLNAMHPCINRDEATSTWVSEAIEDARVEPKALYGVVTKRFGEKSVIYDPSDPEGTKIAMSQGYTVIPGGALSKGTWDNIRNHSTRLPAGQVTPSPKPYDPNGRPERVISRDEWTPDMWRMAEFAEGLFHKLIDEECSVYIVTEPQAPWTANFGGQGILGYTLCLNFGRLGKKWFSRPKRDEVLLSLLIHEFAHHFSLDHLSARYHDGLCSLGAKLALVALNEPTFFSD